MCSIVVPCFNEDKNLPLILAGFRRALGERTDIELILVNNGSTDASAETLKQLIPAHAFARAVTVFPNRGYGFGIRAGLKEARGEFAGWTHADMQTDPADVVRAFDLLKGQPDALIKGDRRHRPWRHRIVTIGMGIFESLLFQRWIYEINAQPTVFHKSFLPVLADGPDDFSLDLYGYVMAKRGRKPVIHFPVEFPPRVHGTSSWDTSLRAKMRAIGRTIRYSVRLRMRLLWK